MQTDSIFDSPQAANGNGGHIKIDTRKERYNHAGVKFTTQESDFNARLDARRRSAGALRDRHLVSLDAAESEHKADRSKTKQKLDEAKVDLDAAHRAASEHCGEIGIQYVPGKTTEDDILQVPLPEDAEMARRIGLPFGVGFNDKLVHYLKPLLTLLCWLMSSMSLGLGFRLLQAKNIFTNPTMVGLSLVMGGVTAIGLLVAVTPMWKSLGTKVGAGRPTKEVVALLFPFTLITVGLMTALAFLDAKAIIFLNAARATFNPIYSIPMEVALLIGLVISGVYVIGLSVSAFADGYTAAAKKSIQAEITRDKNSMRDAAKQRVPIRKALEGLADVEVAEEAIRRLKNDLMIMDAEFKRERTGMLASVPQIPTSLEPDELKELTDLRDHVRAAKTNLQAHIESRGGPKASTN